MIVNTQYAGSGNGTGFYGSHGSWTLNLSFTPTPGNYLIVYVGTFNPVNPNVCTYTGSPLTLSFSNGTINANVAVFSGIVPGSPATSITLQFPISGNAFSTVIQEVSGLSSNMLDQTSHSTGSGFVYSTGSTSTTTANNEFLANAWVYYNPSTGGDPGGESPSNGYTLSSGNPAKYTDLGWSWTSGSPIPVGTATVSSGILIANKTVSSTGTAGGTVTDLHSNTNTWYGVALTFFGINANPAIFGTLNSLVNRRYPPLK